ncbi:hypothetical protein Leryth_010759 [Lithospermum erythrorhizon]|nr:hypothetical protein Leryth_010759 [Lithospermum erythrorhizon]
MRLQVSANANVTEQKRYVLVSIDNHETISVPQGFQERSSAAKSKKKICFGLSDNHETISVPQGFQERSSAAKRSEPDPKCY